MARWVLESVSPSPPFQFERSSPPNKRDPSSLLFFLGGAVLLVISLILLCILWKWVRPKRSQKMLVATNKGIRASDAFSRNLGTISHLIDCAPEVFSGNLRTISHFNYRTLRKATENFRPTNQLGRGGFGPVYKGVLEGGRMIAVKKLSLEKSQQGESEFLSEVRLITSIQHKNLVRLLGCCADGPQRLLVYEFMKNGSLDEIVYGKRDQFLDWKMRFQIIVGIARGLQYLHEDSHLRIVHRDIKASNILLDEKFQPKIGDFGLARFFPEDQTYLSTTFAGTLGYTAPEYAIRGELSEKVDIYSFGVLLLEIVSCRRNTDHTLPSEMQYLPEYAWKLYEKSKLADLVDHKLVKDRSVQKEILQVMNIALLCLQPLPNLRPPMSEIVALLTCMVEMTATPVKPAFLDRKQNKNENVSWEDISGAFPSPPVSDSPSFPWQEKSPSSSL